MKICFLNHNLIHNTGAGRFGLALIERLRKARPDIEAIVLTSASCGHPLEKPILYSSKLRLILALPRIRKVFRQCDIIHALDGWPYGAIAALASFGLGKKLVITAIGTGAIQPFRHPIRGALLRWAYRRADKLAAISSYTKREIWSQDKNLDVIVINHAVDVGEFLDPKEDLTEEEKLEIKKLKPYILSVGGWKKRKGFEYSFAAFAEIQKRFPNLSYVVCGIGPKPWLEQPLGLEGSVHYFKGVRWPFLKALYKSAELFMLLPYDDRGDVEGFGFAFLEAAAAGLPVIGTAESGAEDAIDQGQNGFLVEPKSASAAAQAAIRILSDAELARRMSAASLDFARKMNWDRVIGQYQEIYDEVLSKNKSKIQSTKLKTIPNVENSNVPN